MYLILFRVTIVIARAFKMIKLSLETYDKMAAELGTKYYYESQRINNDLLF